MILAAGITALPTPRAGVPVSSSCGRVHLGDYTEIFGVCRPRKSAFPPRHRALPALSFGSWRLACFFFWLRSSKRLVERFGKPQREFPRLPPKVSLAATCQWFWEAAVQVWCLQVLNKNDPGVVKSRYQSQSLAHRCMHAFGTLPKLHHGMDVDGLTAGRRNFSSTCRYHSMHEYPMAPTEYLIAHPRIRHTPVP